MDDLNTRANSADKGYCFYTKAKNVLSQASFNFRKFQSNSTDYEIFVNGYKMLMHKKTFNCWGFYGIKNPMKLYLTSKSASKTDKEHSGKMRFV